MKKGDLAGKVLTVLGLIDPEDLGVTNMHNHIYVDLTVWFEEPKKAREQWLSRQPVTLENLSWVVANEYKNRDNMFLHDEQVAIKELMYYKLAGGHTIVDPVNDGFGRDPVALARISRATGLNVIMGSGYYCGMEAVIEGRSEEELAEEIITDILSGVEETRVHSGVIGEIGVMSSPLQDFEKKTLGAAARVQQETGATIYVHPGRHESSPMEIIEFLDKAGVDLSRVIMCHMDRTGYLLDTRLEIAKTGCCFEYDLFGAEKFYTNQYGVFDRPSDAQRIRQIIELIEKGYLKQIVIGDDIAMKIRLVSYGGTGYAHILENIVPQMRARGMAWEEIDTLLIDNPRRLLTFS